MNVSIIGTGNMARGIGTRLVAGGHTVNLHAHTPQKGEEAANILQASVKQGGAAAVKTIGDTLDDIVVLAVHYDTVKDVVAEYDNQFEGKTVIDITNPVDFATMQLKLEPGVAGAQEIAKQMPSAKVVKAFNTVFSSTLLTNEVGGQPLDIFIAGDDSDAKLTVTQLITDGGMRAIDAGNLANARHLEGLALIHMSVQQPLGLNFASSIKILS